MRATAATRLISLVDPTGPEARTKQFVGFPPELGLGERREMGRARVVLLLEEPDGFYLLRWSSDGDFAGDTWHRDLKEAQDQADWEYQGALGKWEIVPEDLPDAELYAQEKARE